MSKAFAPPSAHLTALRGKPPDSRLNWLEGDPTPFHDPDTFQWWMDSSGMKFSHYSEEVDPHVLAMVTILFTIAVPFVPFPFPALGYCIFPQGRILTKAFVDLRSHRKPFLAYIFVNESLIVLATLLNWLIFSLGFKGLISRIVDF